MSDCNVGTTTITSAQTLTNAYALCENALQYVVGAGTNKWFQLYGETECTLEISYTTGAAETNNYIEFYIEYGSGAPALIDWHKETVEYLDDSANQIILEEYTYRIDGAAAGTEYTKRIQLPVCTKGIRIYVKEVGVAANYGSLTIKANVQSAGASHYNRHLQTVTLEPSADSGVYQDDTGFTAGTSYTVSIAGYADDTSPDTVNEHDIGALRMGLDRVLYVQGQVAHDAAFSGNSVPIGGKALSAKPAAVTANDMVNAYFDLYGRQHIYDEGGGGVGGGGFSTYVFDATNSNGMGTSAYAGATTFTVSGHSFTPDVTTLVKVDRFSSAGAFQETISPSQSTITASTTAGVTTYTVAGASFTAGDLFVVYQNGPERTVSLSTDSQRSEEINPMSHMGVQESWADTTNVGAGPTYYPSADGKEMTGIKSISFTGKLIDGDAEANTFTIEGTNDEDSVSTNRDWITLYGYRSDTDAYVNSVGITTATTLTFGWDFDCCNYKYVRAKFIGGASATNTVILKCRTVAL